jgi:hypothetical protein
MLIQFEHFRQVFQHFLELFLAVFSEIFGHTVSDENFLATLFDVTKPGMPDGWFSNQKSQFW